MTGKVLVQAGALAALAVGLGWGQGNTGRFGERTARGMELTDRGDYRQAINILEEVWEQDRSNPAVAENLAIAYLYGERNGTKARQYMEQAIASGGQASFLMHHAHEKATVLAGSTSDYCPGRLSIRPGRLVLTAGEAAHSFDIPAAQLKEIKANRWFAAEDAAYHVRTVDKKNYNLRPKTWLAGERDLVMEFVGRYVKTSQTR